MAFLTCGRRPPDDGDESEEVNVDMVLQSDTMMEKQKEIFEAINRVDVRKVESLIAEPGIELKEAKETEAEYQREAFHFFAAIEAESLSIQSDDDLKQMFNILFVAGCNVNCTDKFGNTPLMLAAEKGNTTILKLLLDKGADAAKTNREDNSPLHWAAKNGQREAVSLLLRYGKANINAQNKEFETPLHLAVMKGKKGVVKLLISQGADVNLKDLRNKKTPVQHAKTKSMENLFQIPNDSRTKRKKQLSSSRQGEEVVADSGEVLPELDVCFRSMDLQTIEAETAAAKVVDLLKLDRLSVKDPPRDVVIKCRRLCFFLKQVGRKDIVRVLKEKLPNGMTGPSEDETMFFEDIQSKERKNLTKALCGKWKMMASVLGIPREQLDYYDRQPDPVEAILREFNELTIEELYDVLDKCDAAALADKYL